MVKTLGKCSYFFLNYVFHCQVTFIVISPKRIRFGFALLALVPPSFVTDSTVLILRRRKSWSRSEISLHMPTSQPAGAVSRLETPGFERKCLIVQNITNTGCTFASAPPTFSSSRDNSDGWICVLQVETGVLFVLSRDIISIFQNH